MQPLNLFAGERALVTGSASNIGRAIAEALAREGADVTLVDVDPARNAATLKAITEAGGTATALTADLSRKDAWKDVVAALGDRHMDIFVHAASPPRKEADSVLNVSEDIWDGMVNVNVRSGFFLARDLAKRMKAGGVKGRILFITSLHAGSPRNLPHYSSSKAGQTMIVKELARALGPAGIRVNAIAPGAISGGGFNAGAVDWSDKIALGRIGVAEDIAGPAVALLSDRFCRYVTGTTMVVDGGIALHNWIKPAQE
jgi:NAD(P)-dependent dehydrogenase (short-subunit alcohol dehydrogenase family)